MLEVVQRIICGHCKEPIEPRQGIIIQGNVYAVSEEVTDRGGIVGNNFPQGVFSNWFDPKHDMLDKERHVHTEFKFTFDDVQETAFHGRCLFKMLREQDIKCE